MADGTGKRFNEGKTRHDLVPAYAQEQYAKVLTFGAKRYNDRNWEKGMKWTSVIASLERHLQAIKRGEDIDPESGLLHSAHIQCNSAFLTEYYKIYPQGDDRIHWYKLRPRIGLDVDEVLADFMSAYNERFEITNKSNWHFDPKIKERLEVLKDDKEFWMNIKPLISPKDIPFEPFCYVTSRVCDISITELWLHQNGFSSAPVYCSYGEDKTPLCVASNCEIFVDDFFGNFVKINETGKVLCYLWSREHNLRYDVGHKRLNSFKDLPLFN